MKIINSFLASVLIIMVVVLTISRQFRINGTKGIDVSHHNSVNWEKVAAQTDVKFAFIKITEGSTFIDYMGKKHIISAENNGIKTGAYHYFSTKSSAKNQFANFKRNFLQCSSLVPMVDVEDIDGISSKQLNESVKEFCVLVEKELGAKPIVYTRPDLYYSVFVKHDFLFWRKYTFFFWQPIPIHPVFSTGKLRCLWQYSTNRDRIEGTSIIDKDVLSLINLNALHRTVI